MGRPHEVRRLKAKGIAKAIVEDLFTNGIGEHADRLVLVSANGKDLGGYCKEAIRKAIFDHVWAGIKDMESAAALAWLRLTDAERAKIMAEAGVKV